MKASEAIKQATKLHDRIEKLLEPVNKKLTELLGTDAHVEYIQGDGWCVCYESDTSHVCTLIWADIDAILKSDDAEVMLLKWSV